MSTIEMLNKASICLFSLIAAYSSVFARSEEQSKDERVFEVLLASDDSENFQVLELGKVAPNIDVSVHIVISNATKSDVELGKLVDTSNCSSKLEMTNKVVGSKTIEVLKFNLRFSSDQQPRANHFVAIENGKDATRNVFRFRLQYDLQDVLCFEKEKSNLKIVEGEITPLTALVPIYASPNVNLDRCIVEIDSPLSSIKPHLVQQDGKAFVALRGGVGPLKQLAIEGKLRLIRADKSIADECRIVVYEETSLRLDPNVLVAKQELPNEYVAQAFLRFEECQMFLGERLVDVECRSEDGELLFSEFKQVAPQLYKIKVRLQGSEIGIKTIHWRITSSLRDENLRTELFVR